MITIKQNNYNRILVIGDLMLDRHHYGHITRKAPEGNCPVVTCDHIDQHPGGAANVATIAARLGANVTVAGVISDDINGIMLKSLLLGDSINTALVNVAEDGTTTVKNRIFDDRGTLMLRVDCDRNEGSVAAQKITEILDRFDTVIISDYNKGVVTPTLSRAVIDSCRQRGIPVIADIKTGDSERYRGATVVKGTAAEIALLDPTDSLDAELIISTNGADGLTATTRDGRQLNIKPVITAGDEIMSAGAGDMLTAVIALGIHNEPPERLLSYAVDLIARALCRHGNLEVDAITLAPTDTKLTTADTLNKLRPYGRMVFTNGCFDILHPGHEHLLRKAASLGDYLVVGLNSDSSVRRLKGDNRPVNSVDKRIAALARMPWVDLIITFDDDTPAELIETLRPDILVKGGDYTIDTVVGADATIHRGGRVEIIPLLPGFSTTSIIEHDNR